MPAGDRFFESIPSLDHRTVEFRAVDWARDFNYRDMIMSGDDFRVTNQIPMNHEFNVQLGGKTLIKITKRGEGFHVEADTLAGASEAALVFVESIKDHLRTLR